MGIRRHIKTALLVCLWGWMANIPLVATALSDVDCNPLPRFNHTDWQSVEIAFTNAVAMPFQQSWLEKTEPRFQSGTVRLGWQADALWVFGVMEDGDIFNPTSRMNQLLDPRSATPGHRFNVVSTTSGDVFEVFVRRDGSDPYYEFHVTPQNQVLQLRWKDRWDFYSTRWEEGAKNPFASHLIDGSKVFESYTRVDGDRKQWRVLLRVPARLLKGAEAISPGDVWIVSCSRYDLTRGNTEPVFTSTSLHRRNPPSFHRQEEWRRLRFVK